MHTTVLSKGECEQYLKDCSSKCPFCLYTSMPQLMYYHIKNHFQWAVQHHVSYYSRMGRVMVAYDKKKNNWHCPCARPRQSCIHKATAKWHLFQMIPQLFKRVKSSEEVFNTAHTCNDDASGQDLSYPPNSTTVKRMMKYMLENKKIPVEIPQTIMQKSKHGKAFNNFPKHLVPEEVECGICKGVLSEPMMITCRAKIVTFNGVIQGVSTYYKLCHKCNLTYRYQEWSDGLHNFNDNVIVSLHLCVVLRNSLQNHTAVGRVVQTIEATEGESLPKGDLIMQAYLHFESLCDLDYIYSCVSCGYNPSTVIMDLHKKGVFSIPVSEIQSPPATYDGHVDIEEFWDAVAMDMISRGFYPSGKENPFTVSPSYHNWSPWIGPKTRESAMVLNTESAKVKSSNDGSDIDVPFTEERLGDELLHLKVFDLKKLCRQCGVDDVGSKMDLILRLRNKMSNRVTYNKVFEQVWGASGGLGVIMCPCGVVYSIKFNLRAESPRDFADLLLSWKHFPNITIYDYPRGLVAHTNNRKPLHPPFHPFEGRVQDPSSENIQKAKEGKLKVHLPWLTHKKKPMDPDCHPLTASSEHYCLCDVFHQSNSKDKRDVLRTIGLVPELAGKINSQCAEQLFSEVKRNNYFMNMIRPSAHIFLARNILHHRNLTWNRKKLEQFKKLFSGSPNLQLDSNGKVILGAEPEPNVGPNYSKTTQTLNTTLNEKEMHTAVQSQCDPKLCRSPVVTSLNIVKSSKTFWGTMPNEGQQQLINNALDVRKCKDELLATVYNTTLNRSDLCCLGLERDVEGTILNCCLKVVETIAKSQNVNVFSASSHQIETWPNRTLEEQLLHLPLDENIDWFIFPTWIPGHWMVCKHCTNHVSWALA
ncbi:uncharacterized protein LOC143748537 [Siphateles boraxobius]|uniref:uncharacterized protein LOC143748537 n=1 Tax=Siphateles boraxobius TaxID=180520 RepID=UPI0040645978